MLNDDLDVLFSGPDAVTVTIGASSFKGLLDSPDESIADGMVISTDYLLTMKTSDASNTEEREVIQVDEIDYSVRSIKKVSDGRLCELSLSKE